MEREEAEEASETTDRAKQNENNPKTNELVSYSIQNILTFMCFVQNLSRKCFFFIVTFFTQLFTRWNLGTKLTVFQSTSK